VKTTKKKTPSRIRYEQAHPTVSCRVPRKVYDRLQKVKIAEVKSFSDIIKIGLGILEVKAEEEGNIKKQSHADGYRKGYAEAERLYRVTYPCSICGKTVELISTNAKQVASGYMQEHGWGHRACHERRG
jgi:predicted CopG family antitoxin